MCGIAGYSLSRDSRVHRTLAAQALLAGIAERGADAVGYAWRDGGRDVSVHKQRSGASMLLDRIDVPAAATEVLLHVRDYTKGHPSIEANNHPIRHGAVVGIHNGIIANDDEIFARYGIARQHPEMTVDSEVIFALADRSGGSAAALQELRGAMATAWLDERREGVLFLARGTKRPLWTGHTRHELFFASTRDALEVVERCLRMTLSKREVPEGIVLELDGGRVVSKQRFAPSLAFTERELPAVRAPHERAFCLQQLAVLAAAA